MAHVAQIVVVHQDHFHRSLLFHDGAQFLDVHLETAVTHETAYRTLRSAEGGTNGSRHTIAHGSQSTAGADATLVMIFEITSGEELVLTNIRHQNRVIGSLLGNGVDHLAHE